MVYIASDRSLAPIPWDPDAPRFFVAPLDERQAVVRRCLPYDNVMYAGSHEHCGCGFRHGEYGEYEEDAPDFVMGLDSRRRLGAYAAAVVEAGGACAIYACWSGDEAEEPESSRVVTLEELTRGTVFFEERELVTVH